jgi:hypothetical protein
MGGSTPYTYVAPKPAAGRTGTAAAAGASSIATMTPAQLNQYIATLSPDYGGYGVAPINPQDAADYATKGAADWLAPQEARYQSDLAMSQAQRKLSTDASTNFTQALSGILTGGLEGQAGRDYALKTFGGSFLGEVQAVQGMKMFVDITRDFNQQDYQLLQKIDSARQQQPEIYDKLYSNFYAQELDNQKMGIGLAESDYEHRMKAAALILANQSKTADRAAADERSRLANLTKIIVASKKNGQNPYVLKRPDGSQDLIDKNTGQVIAPLSGPKPVAPTKARTQQSVVGGRKVILNMDTGAIVKDLGPAPVGAAKVTFQGVRSKALAQAQALWVSKDRPPWRKQTFDALMTGYGNVLLANGYKPATVKKMINAVMTSASAGRSWDTGGTGSGRSKTT